MNWRLPLRIMRAALLLAITPQTGGGLRWLVAVFMRRAGYVDVKIDGLVLRVRANHHDLPSAILTIRELSELPDLGYAKDGLIVDGGGFIGAAALWFARRYPDAIVFTIEPDLDNFAMLAHNVANVPNVVPYNAALAPEPGEAAYFDRGTGPYGLTLVAKAADRKTEEKGRTRLVSIPELMKRARRDEVFLVKLDIEGGERQLLENSTDWISNTYALCVELHERIVPGTERIFDQATATRTNHALSEEKILSLRR